MGIKSRIKKLFGLGDKKEKKISSPPLSAKPRKSEVQRHVKKQEGKSQRTKLKNSLTPIEPILLNTACKQVENSIHRSLPFKERGIKIDKELIQATMEILNSEPSKTLPQNPREDLKEKTPDGLDYRIKVYRNSDIRTANIMSDVLKKAGIVDLVKVENPLTGRVVSGTKLKSEWCWE